MRTVCHSPQLGRLRCCPARIVQFLARPAVQPQVFEACVLQDEDLEYDNIPNLDRSINNVKRRQVALAAHCYFHQRFGNRPTSAGIHATSRRPPLHS